MFDDDMCHGAKESRVCIWGREGAGHARLESMVNEDLSE